MEALRPRGAASAGNVTRRGIHARPHPAPSRTGQLRPHGRLRARLRAGLTAMAELVLGGTVTAGLLLYLLWALLRPEDL
ncbi:potassium-transporting ATPase subunit F [Roseomonas sp. KE2513]|nr:potassium-transporting ATPase subunit F [Roseomonas sp. KE2513]